MGDYQTEGAAKSPGRGIANCSSLENITFPKKLTGMEYEILRLLIKNRGRTFTSDEIYERVWNEDSCGSSNVVSVHIRHIREKIEINPKKPQYIQVVWGVGYRMEK